MDVIASDPKSPSIASNRAEHDKRITEKLRRELGPQICELLEDSTVIEIMLNPDGTLWVERLGAPMEKIGTLPASRAESLMGTVASTLRTQITALNPILECELPELMNRYLAANGQAAGMGGMGGGMPGMGGGGMGGNSMAAENQQDRKQAFLAGTPEAEVYLARQRKAAIAPSQEIKAGWVIPGVMISGINSDLPGQIIGQVREAVYDSATGTQCLIPPGSRVVGTYDSGVTLGQQRALAVWRRIIYPDGSSISIDNMPGADMGGYAGFNDKVNNHYLRIFGSGLLLSVFSAGIQLSQPQASNGENYSSSQIIAGSLGQQMGQIGMQMAQRNMNIQPTLEIRPGYEFNIMVTKDIILPTWEGHPMAGSTGKGCN